MMWFKRQKVKPSIPQDIHNLENCYVSKSSQAIWKSVDGKGVILNTKTASYCTVEETSLRVWELIEKGIIISELINTITDEYGVDRNIIKSDIAELLDSMRKDGIIELKPEEVKDGKEK